MTKLSKFRRISFDSQLYSVKWNSDIYRIHDDAIYKNGRRLKKSDPIPPYYRFFMRSEAIHKWNMDALNRSHNVLTWAMILLVLFSLFGPIYVALISELLNA